MNGIISRKSRAWQLTFLFERCQSFDEAVHRCFQVREEASVDIVQAFNKFTVIHKLCFDKLLENKIKQKPWNLHLLFDRTLSLRSWLVSRP